MALFVWKDAYSVNIKEIDDQHKKLIDMINELNDAMAQGKAKEMLGAILDKLVAYTASHFAVEERLMQTHGYDDYPAHKEKHEKMTAKVLDLQRQFKSGQAAMTIEVMNFLKNWLDKHIVGTDMKYSAFLNSKGVQ